MKCKIFFSDRILSWDNQGDTVETFIGVFSSCYKKNKAFTFSSENKTFVINPRAIHLVELTEDTTTSETAEDSSKS
jgi:hypothetical protein